MRDRPVGVGHAVQREVVALVGQAEVLHALEVVEHAKGVVVELGGRLGHGEAEVANGEGDVGAGVDGAVEECAHKGLVAPSEVVVDLVGAAERVGDVHRE